MGDFLIFNRTILHLPWSRVSHTSYIFLRPLHFVWQRVSNAETISASDILSVQRFSRSPSNILRTMRNWFGDMPFWTSSFFIVIVLLATTLTLSKCEIMDDANILASPRSNRELNFRNIIDPPLRKCPKHQKRDHLGKCRDIFGVPTNGCGLPAAKIVDLLAIIYSLRIFSSLLRL